MPAGLTKPTTTTASTSAPPSSGNIPGVLNTPEPNSSYGYQCGPAAGHNALGGYGVNYPIGSGSYPNATYLTYDMQTTQSSGTNRGPMPTALNNREKQDTYVWQNLGGTSDVSYYTTLDIEYKDAPIYNIETYGYDPLNGTYEYPFYQWNGWDIRHYVTAYGYSSSGSWISISDPAVKGSYTAAQRYTQWYSDVWVAINNLPLTNQILW